MKYSIFFVLTLSLITTGAWADYNRTFGPYSEKLYTKTKSDSKGNDKFSSGYKFVHDISYEKGSLFPYAAHMGSTNTVDVKVFKNFTIAEVGIMAAMNETNPDHLVKFKRTTKFFGINFYSKNSEIYGGLGKPITLWSSLDDKGKEKYAIYQRYTHSFPFTLGPIPFEVEAGFQGVAGIKGSLMLKTPLAAHLEFKAGPFFDLDGVVAAGVNLLLVKGNAEADVTLIGGEQLVTAAVRTSIANKSASLEFGLPGKIHSLDGKVTLNGYARSVKICKAGFIRFPCGIIWAKVGSWKILSWDGYSQTWSLYSYKKQFGG